MTTKIQKVTAQKHRPWMRDSAGWIVSVCLMFALAGCVSSPAPSTAHSVPPPTDPTASSSGNLLTRWLPSHRESAAQLALLHQRYGQWQEQLGNLTEARKSYEYALGETPKSIDAIIGLARLDHLAGRDRQAEQGFLKAIRLKPNDPRTHEAAGEFYAAQRLWTKAIAQLNSAMMAAPSEPSYRYHLAVALARSGDLNAAMPHFVQTVGEAEAHYNIGYILAEQGNRSAAEQHFIKALALRPDLTQAQTMLADLRRSATPQQLASQSAGFRSHRVERTRQRQPTSTTSPIRPVSAAVPSMTVAPQRPLAGGRVSRQTYRHVFPNSVPQTPALQTSPHSLPTNPHPAPVLTPQMEQRRNQLGRFSGTGR